VRVSRAFYDSTVSKILGLIENAASKKSKTENFITRFARIYTPVVVFSAIALGVIPSIITGEWSVWLYRALSFLVVSCPCAIVVSVPLSFVAALGASSRSGILIKGSEYIEKTARLGVVAFDKTGTLTKGNFAVVALKPEERGEEILRLAATAEEFSAHPIALSVKARYGKEGEKGYTLTNIAGEGVVATKNSETILCGNARLMKRYGVKYEENADTGTVVYVAKGGEFVGSLTVSDEIKEESKAVVAALNADGIKTVMLTGDGEKVAADVAEKLGLSTYRAALLPQNKVEEVEKLLKEKPENKTLCFAGDGINDAPVLMRADIGVAMGGVGSDAAIEAADIVLMKDDLSGLPVLRRIAKKTMLIVKENVVFSLAVKFSILALSAFGVTNMWAAVFGDVGVAILAILNAMRVKK
ncbi:MAG: cadmium-translocating P-type ATPase, partial [Clostridia bacterium]|nr:cadmium-translocating P-type ATPase [Clostridia bacterium]